MHVAIEDLSRALQRCSWCWSRVSFSAWEATRARQAEATAKAVNDFLQNDLLSQASANNQARPDTKPDPDLKVRTALERAAARISGKFNKQPIIEASIRQTIGSTYQDLGLYPEAQRQVERAFELRKRILGKEHPDTLTSMNSLAELYCLQGNYVQAEPVFVEVLELRGRVLGEEHRDTLESMNNLAVLYFLQGKYVQAEPLSAKVLERRQRVLGQEHRDTLESMNNLAVLYYFQGRYAQAEPLFLSALQVLRRVLGEEHSHTLSSINNLGWLYYLQGKYVKAEPLLTKVLQTWQRVLGEEHPNTVASMRNLAVLYRDEGKYVQAESLFAKVLEIEPRVLGPAHPRTLAHMNDLALLYLKTGQYAQAERLLRDALPRHKAANSPTWDRYYCESLLGGSLAGQRKYPEAEPLLVAGYERMRERANTLPPCNRLQLEQAGKWIVQLYQDWGKPDKAAEWRARISLTLPTTQEQ